MKCSREHEENKGRTHRLCLKPWVTVNINKQLVQNAKLCNTPPAHMGLTIFVVEIYSPREKRCRMYNGCVQGGYNMAFFTKYKLSQP